MIDAVAATVPIDRVRALARACAQAYFEARKQLGFPLADEELKLEFLSAEDNV